MAKRNSQLTELLIVAQDDYLTIVDTSAGQSKRVSVKNLTGAPDFTWTATGESWSYSSFNSTLQTGVITVPSDATTKYSIGMWVRFGQTTGGTKYGKILAVATTSLTVDFPNGSVLANEAITAPVYSPLARPYGVPADTSFNHTYTNTGSGGGTGYFRNDNGVKRVWGISGTHSAGGNQGLAYTMPTGFLSSVDYALSQAYNPINTTIPGNWAQNSISTSQVGVFSGGTTANSQGSWLVIGR